MKKIRSHFVFIYLMFFVGVILTVDLLINGRDFFLNDKGHIGVLLAIGMLTFVSIFFSLIISVKKNIQKFLIWTDVTKNLVKNESIRRLKNEDFPGLNRSTTYIHLINLIKIIINPPLWIYLSVVSYLFSLSFGLISDSQLAKNLQAITFYLGLMCTFFLITSIAHVFKNLKK